MTGSLRSMSSSTRLQPGDTAPGFSASDQTGATRSLTDYTGRKLVLYFYPKAFTPGCTTESCDFRDRWEHFKAQGFDILGVSPDTPDRLAAFKAEYELPFDLLSDPDHDIATSYGAYGEKKNYGKTYLGIIRSTIIIDDDGTVTDAFYNVRAKGHAERIAGATGVS